MTRVMIRRIACLLLAHAGVSVMCFLLSNPHKYNKHRFPLSTSSDATQLFIFHNKQKDGSQQREYFNYKGFNKSGTDHTFETQHDGVLVHEENSEHRIAYDKSTKAGNEPHFEVSKQGNFTDNGKKGSAQTLPTKAKSVDVSIAAVAAWSEIMRQGWTENAFAPFKTTGVMENYNKALNMNKKNGANAILDESVLSGNDLAEIEKYWDRLMPTVSYLGTEQVARIYKALCVAYSAHNGQKRKSGEPFIVHPVEVALLLAGLKMDGSTVCAGLLHDTVEDTELTFDQVESLFGHTVRSIVEGETKVSKLPKQLSFDGEGGQNKDEIEQNKQADEQAENLRQMFVAMTDDYRIIIVKLADRLHNMRTLQHMKPEKQIKISRETLDIFAPLAHRMGIWQFKSELEDTAFMYLYPMEYNRLNRRLQLHSDKFRATLESSKQLLQSRVNNDPTLQQQALKVQVIGRTKEMYSLWHKMETKDIRNLENVIDVVALRVIITPNSDYTVDSEINKSGNMESDRGVWLCYHVLGLVQHLHGFQPVPTRVKDYISFPKPNGYQSIHTALILNGQTIEVQIRTSMMHQVAEYGMASHWAYTQGKRRSSTEGDDIYNTPWLSSIKEWQNDRISSRDFVDSVRRELLGKRVFVFLRNGKILNLARGASAIDAAFQIHTEVGLNMHGVEVNGRSVPLSYTLKNGDVVSILTGEGNPSIEWMQFAKSRSTRSKLRAYFRAQQRESLRETGKILLQDYLFRYGLLIGKESYLPTSFSVPVPGTKSFEKDLEPFLPNCKVPYENVDDLLVAIGKHHDHKMLQQTVSQLFGINRKSLHEGDGKQQHSEENAIESVLGLRRQIPNNLREPINSVEDNNEGESDNQQQQNLSDTGFNSFEGTQASIESNFEYADPELVCRDCLPVYGDIIVGTSFDSASKSSSTVHRLGCPRAQKVINNAWALGRKTSRGHSTSGGINMKGDSKSKRQLAQNHLHVLRSEPSADINGASDQTAEVAVKLKWFDLNDNDGTSHEFLTEIVVHAEDRKLLLADCSIVVSDMSEIVKTGSLTHNEHATLVFLVKVKDINHIQRLMDGLSVVKSVMSVERRFGSELL